MSSRMWKFLSTTIGKLQSPRNSQQNDDSEESSSLRQTNSPSDTPTRHGSSKTAGGQLVDTDMSLVQDEPAPDTPLTRQSKSIKKKLEEAATPTTENNPQKEQEDVTAINLGIRDDGYTQNPKSTKKSPSDGSFAITPPRHGCNKGRRVAEAAQTAEPLAHNEPLVEAPSRATRGRGRPSRSKKAEAVASCETSPQVPHADSYGLGGENVEELVEPLTINEHPVDNPLSTHRTRGRGRYAKAAEPVAYKETPSIPHGERSDMEVDTIAAGNIEEVKDLSPRDENQAEPQTNSSTTQSRILSKTKEPANTPEPLVKTATVGSKRTRDILESSTGNEGPKTETETPTTVSTKRRKLAPKPEGMDIPPVGTTQAARDERRKYMDRERQRRCRQRKKERQQGEQAVEREVVSQAKDERKKAMARERVRRHRENQRQKRGPEIEAKMGDKQRLREEARQRDRELIASGGRKSATAPLENETSNTQ